MRHYGFNADEILPPEGSGTLPLDIDPKMAWALAHRERFPVDVNAAERELMLRVPGVGVRNVDRILASRQQRRLRYQDLVRLRCNMKAARAFVITDDYHPGGAPASSALRKRAAAQLPLL